MLDVLQRNVKYLYRLGLIIIVSLTIILEKQTKSLTWGFFFAMALKGFDHEL